MAEIKLSIHSDNWERLIEEIRKEIPQPYSGIVVGVLHKFATPVF